MQVTKIQVFKLFGVFDHEIPLNEDNVTIVIGENGLGKTIILEMLSALFEKKYFFISQISFESLVISFSDGKSWIIDRTESDGGKLTLTITLVHKNGKMTNPFSLLDFHGDINSIAIAIKRSRLPNIRRIGPSHWEDRRTGRIYDSEDLVSTYGYLLPIYDNTNTPGWLSKRINEINVVIIETQRLVVTDGYEGGSLKENVNRYSDKIKEQINDLLSRSTVLSAKLDRTYPDRLVNRIKNPVKASDEKLNDQLKELERKREILDAVGLIEIDKDSSLLDIGKTDDVLREVLALYIEDSFKKIEIFDRLSNQIETLLEIINKRFKHKRLHITKVDGFLFKSTIIQDSNGEQKTIPIKKLSSGEKNELILFYLLLFVSSENSLVLIDEPELSLHISWQNCFVEDLKEIAKLNRLKVVITTHSPDIISGNWDLKVELEGVE